MIVGLDHVQIAAPPGGEEDARRFYRDLLGMIEVPKPQPLAARGGCWFEASGVQLHVGIEEGFSSSAKAHVAFLVGDLDELGRRLSRVGLPFTPDTTVEGRTRAYTTDLFGNRVELIADGDGFSQRKPRHG